VSDRELRESANGALISDVIDDVMWLYDIILVMAQSSKSPKFGNRTRINYLIDMNTQSYNTVLKISMIGLELWEKKQLA